MFLIKLREEDMFIYLIKMHTVTIILKAKLAVAWTLRVYN